jgi:D-3-phosphoglycerate dehydrogenase
MKLAEQLGSFAGQLTETGLKKVSARVRGRGRRSSTRKPLTAIRAAYGPAAPLLDSVNMVNAPVVAKERGIEVAEVKHEREADYSTP